MSMAVGLIGGRRRPSGHLVGHMAARARVEAFVPDYRLTPEHPFPAAVEDVRASYFGLIERGYSKIAVTGASAGGNLALGLLVFRRTGPEAKWRR
jgi:monoterpene epsilon-lactone hydrolase